MRLVAIAWIIFWTGLGVSQITGYGCLFLSAGAVGTPWLALSALVVLPAASALLLIWTRTLLVRPIRTTTLPLASHGRWILPAFAAVWFAFNGWEGYLPARARLHQISEVRVHSWPHGPNIGHTALVAPDRAIAELRQLLLLKMGYHLSGAVMDLGLALAMFLVARSFRPALMRDRK
jgi:hypothetical protein